VEHLQRYLEAGILRYHCCLQELLLLLRVVLLVVLLPLHSLLLSGKQPWYSSMPLYSQQCLLH
jgi:hypothetical protein